MQALLLAAALLLPPPARATGDESGGDSAPAAEARAIATDVTFFVTADLHFGATADIEALNRKQVEAMNALPGRRWPAAGYGPVAQPAAVLVAGDLTDHGLAGEWKQFAALYGLGSGDGPAGSRTGLLKWPVYECTGNHDRILWLARPVLAEVRKRHGDLCYSLDLGGVHVVCLDLYPDKEHLAWLGRDLAKVGPKRAVVIFFHYGLAGPFADWWSAAEKLAFAKAVADYNVVGIFHGHYHASKHYPWRGLDVYNVGSPRHRWHSFAAVRITRRAMIVASWNWDRGRWQWLHSKRVSTIEPPAPATAPAPTTRPAAGAPATG